MFGLSKIVVLQLLLSTLTKFVRYIIAPLLRLHQGLSTRLERILSFFYVRLRSRIRRDNDNEWGCCCYLPRRAGYIPKNDFFMATGIQAGYFSIPSLSRR